jgi:hypothetical protein
MRSGTGPCGRSNPRSVTRRPLGMTVPARRLGIRVPHRSVCQIDAVEEGDTACDDLVDRVGAIPRVEKSMDGKGRSLKTKAAASP